MPRRKTGVEDLQAKIDKLERLRTLTLSRETGVKPWEPMPHQVRPASNPYLWLLLAGRGAGKTDACAYYFDQFMRRNPGARGGIAAPTLGDAAASCVYGPSGLLAHNPFVIVRARAGGIEIRWRNGSTAALFGAHTMDEVDRFRARGNRHIYWCEELAAWKRLQEAWDIMEPGLRLGRFPHIVASTTPRTRPFLKKLISDSDTVVTRATIYDNPHLPEVQLRRLEKRYKGTRLEAQELLGKYIDDVEGALWTFEMLEDAHVEEHQVPDLARVVVAVDPSGGDSEGNDEQGIIVVGRGIDGHGYKLADRSCKLSPDGWARRAVQAYLDFKADRIIAETNFGGDMVIATVQTAAKNMGVEVATKKITASRGKAARAEPVSALYEQKRFHHVVPPDVTADEDELEVQMRTWTSDSGWSPDRMDALVWGATEVMLGPQHEQIPMRTHRTKRRLPVPGERFAGGV